VPDPASVGQHMHDAAAEMARRGWRVIVLAAGSGYEDASRKYARRESLDAVDIRRFPLSSFGKGSIVRRLLGGTLFLIQAMLHALLIRRVDCILVSTSPPMSGIAGVVLSVLKRARVVFWAMDINPDQLVAVGTISERSLPARIFDWINRAILRRSSDVIALDRFMAATLSRKVPVDDKTAIIPPWPHIDRIDEVLPHAENRFRERHDLGDKFVIMYSGNLSPAHPITTILDAALRLQDRKELLFLFVGGGLGRLEIEKFVAHHDPTNIKLLPYQPLSELRYSLSAADVHLVAMGNEMVGVVHPCKIYGALAVGRPILTVGPRPCHVSDILDEFDVGWQIEHGDVDGAVARIEWLLSADGETLAEIGRHAQQAVSSKFSRSVLCREFCDVLERSSAA
jgi:colanic acid biosynthesis glycosyl transferase WcaI